MDDQPLEPAGLHGAWALWRLVLYSRETMASKCPGAQVPNLLSMRLVVEWDFFRF